MNNVSLIGRLTADVELKTTTTGKQVCSFTVAVSRSFKTEGQPDSDFINCIAWNKTAEFISKNFKKGKRIALIGSIQTRSWDDKDGKKRYATEIIVDKCEFCDDKSPSDNNNPVTNTKSSIVEIENDEDPNDLPF